jgi:hypothetical protein
LVLVIKDLKGFRDYPEVVRAFRAQLVHRAVKGFRAIRASRVIRAGRVLLVHKAKVHRAHRVTLVA